jgi:23S rRNA (guanine745-N1)-methyltransferase
LLRCPVGRLDLAATADTLVCRNSHRFDFAREGYVNLLRGHSRRLPAGGGDSRAQLQRRATFLEAGYFHAIAATMMRHVQQAAAKLTSGHWHVLDAGFGTGITSGESVWR